MTNKKRDTWTYGKVTGMVFSSTAIGQAPQFSLNCVCPVIHGYITVHSSVPIELNRWGIIL